ncbi:MAG: hypothetical protein H6594_06400 [Flavobacteriales bacterium]|nr:hypothetical protein [Flavobacteriales bacterium]
MDKLLQFAIFFLMYAGLLIMVAPAVRRSTTSRWLFIGCWSLYMAVQVVFFGDVLPVRFGEERSSIGWSTLFMGKERKAAHDFLQKNCTLIDVSADIELVPAQNVPDDSLSVVITHRGRLLRLMRFLAHHQDLFDIVVQDVYFQHGLPEDPALRAQLVLLADSGRLAMAHDRSLATDRTIYDDPRLRNAFGEVREGLVGDLYFQNTIVGATDRADDPVPLSLPYRAYCLLNKVDSLEWLDHLFGLAYEPSAKNPGWIELRHPPLFLMAEPDEGLWNGLLDLLGVEQQRVATRDGLGLGRADGMEALAMPMGRLVKEIDEDPEAPFLQAMLRQRMAEEGPHILVIGDFLDPGRDRHLTVQGEMQGALMVTNLIYEFLNGRHRRPFRIFFLIWASLALILALLVWRCSRPAHAPPPPSRHRGWRMVRRAVHGLFVQEFHYWALFILLFVLQVWLHRIVNIMAFAMLLSVVELVLRAYLPPDRA